MGRGEDVGQVWGTDMETVEGVGAGVAVRVPVLDPGSLCLPKNQP